MKRTVLEVAPGALVEYYEWLEKAKPGDTLVYWVGDLQYDRVLDHCPSEHQGEKGPIIAALNAMADRAWQTAKQGHVRLTQKRLGPNEWEYRATRLRSSLGTDLGLGVRRGQLQPA